MLRNEPFSPRALAEAVGAGARPPAPATRRSRPKLRSRADLPAMVAGDALRLRAALENLADNAVKFTSDGTVAFTAGAEPAARGRVRLDLHRRRQRHRHERSANSSVCSARSRRPAPRLPRRYGGAGLGLSFVKRIAKAMGGDLKVTSKTGRGSTFRLTVLAERGGRQPAAERSGRARRARRGRCRCCAPRTIRTAAW